MQRLPNQRMIKYAALTGLFVGACVCITTYCLTSISRDISYSFSDDDYTQQHQPPMSSEAYMGIAAVSIFSGLLACSKTVRDLRQYGWLFHRQQQLNAATDGQIQVIIDAMPDNAAAAAA